MHVPNRAARLGGIQAAHGATMQPGGGGRGGVRTPVGSPTGVWGEKPPQDPQGASGVGVRYGGLAMELLNGAPINGGGEDPYGIPNGGLGSSSLMGPHKWG